MIAEGSYSDFSRIVHESVNRTRVPVNVTIELTNRCPLDCSHCYNNLPMNDVVARKAELSLADYCRVLDELHSLGCLWLLFSGGEIFARTDFLEIYEYAHSKGFLITLFTNGILINERIADRLAARPPFDIEITLYGATEHTYEELTGVPGAYARCRRGLELLMLRGLPVKLKTVAVSTNWHEVRLMREFTEELGLEFKFDPMIAPRIDCSSSPLEVRLTPEEVVRLDLQDDERIAEWKRLASDFAPVAIPEGETSQLYDCGGGVNSFALDPYGNMSICVLSHVDHYNVRDGSVREGWDAFLRNVRSRPSSRVTKCTACALRSLCGMCAANGELENGDAEAPVDFLCRTAHLRAHTFGVDVNAHGSCEYCPGGTGYDWLVQAAATVGGRSSSAEVVPREAATSRRCAPGGCNGCGT